MNFFDKLFNRTATRRFLGAENKSAYIIGDIHGCLDSLNSLMQAVQDRESGPNSHGMRDGVEYIFLGDVIDRGPDSAGVVQYLLEFSHQYGNVTFLKGNHEEIFLKVIAGDVDLLQRWLEYGGRACLRSYGVENIGEIYANPQLVLQEFLSRVPRSHVDFLTSFKDYYCFGDYLCVHAGIRPNLPLEQQKPKDLRWIREPFLSSKRQHRYKVVHGHTIVEDPQDLGNRIAIDTGAYNGGRLTALYVSGDHTEFLQV